MLGALYVKILKILIYVIIISKYFMSFRVFFIFYFLVKTDDSIIFSQTTLQHAKAIKKMHHDHAPILG